MRHREMEELRCLHHQPLCLEHGGSGRFLLTRCYCTSALFSLGGAKCQDKFKCQASREACQSGVSILRGAQISSRPGVRGAGCPLMCMQNTGGLQAPGTTVYVMFPVLKHQRSQAFTKQLSKLLHCCFWLSSCRFPGDSNMD